MKYFEAWNEPNLHTYIQPQWNGKHERRLRHLRAPAQQLLRGGQGGQPEREGGRRRDGALRRRPRGTRRPQPHQADPLLPGAPLPQREEQEEHCPNGEPTKFDIIAHHPINREDPPRAHALNDGDVEIADFGELTKLLRKAEHLGTPGTGGKHGIWANEVWWQTDPPDKAEGISLKKHAAWTAEAFYLLWKQGASNVTFLQFRDAKYTPGEFTLASYQTGVYTYEGKRKPTADVVAFPFVTDDKGKKLLAWGVAPKSGKLTIERKGKGGFKRVDRLSVKSGKVFKTKIPSAKGKQKLRAKVGGETSPVWVQK